MLHAELSIAHGLWAARQQRPGSYQGEANFSKELVYLGVGPRLTLQNNTLSWLSSVRGTLFRMTCSTYVLQ